MSDLATPLVSPRTSSHSSTSVSCAESADSPVTLTGIEVEVRDLDFYVRVESATTTTTKAIGETTEITRRRTKKKFILEGVNARFSPGTITALLGPSGSGKTTMLNVILGNATGTVGRRGGVYVNGVRGLPQHWKALAKLIPQEDVMLPTFSVRETLMYHAELVLPSSTTGAERARRVDEVISSLRLDACANTRVGSIEQRGISGGERKRMSIATELLSNPRLLLVDEPTSGLDSSSAEVVVGILKELASVESGRTVITTIHQPSYRIFSQFTEIVLLTKGRVAFAGRVADAEGFFSRLGHPIPPRENPAEHFMRLLQDDELSVRIPDAFEEETSSPRGRERRKSSSRIDGALSEESLLQQRTGRGAQDEVTHAGRNKQNFSIPDLEGQQRLPSPTVPQPDVELERDDDDQGDENHDEHTPPKKNFGLPTVPQYPISRFRQVRILIRRQCMDQVRDRGKFARLLGVKAATGLLVGLSWQNKASPFKQGQIFSLQGALFVNISNGVIGTLSNTIITFPTLRSLLLREYANGVYALSSFYIAMMVSLTLFSILYVLVMSLPIYYFVGFPLEWGRGGVFLGTGMLCSIIGNALGVSVGAAVPTMIEAQNLLAPVLIPFILYSGYAIPVKDLPVWATPIYRVSFFHYAYALYCLNCFEGMKFEDFNLNILHPRKIRPLRTGDEYLKAMGLDPATHKQWKYALILGIYGLVITVAGYWVVKRSVGRAVGMRREGESVRERCVEWLGRARECVRPRMVVR